MRQFIIKLILLILLISVHHQINSQVLEIQKAEILIHVSGIEYSSGEMKGFLFNDSNTFLKRTFRETTNKVEGHNTITLKFEDVPFGDYAINIYHDRNENGKLDTGLFQIPKEAFGFSNNVRGKMGPPSFEDTRIEVNKKTIEIKIKIK